MVGIAHLALPSTRCRHPDLKYCCIVINMDMHTHHSLVDYFPSLNVHLSDIISECSIDQN